MAQQSRRKKEEDISEKLTSKEMKVKGLKLNIHTFEEDDSFCALVICLSLTLTFYGEIDGKICSKKKKDVKICLCPRSRLPCVKESHSHPGKSFFFFR